MKVNLRCMLVFIGIFISTITINATSKSNINSNDDNKIVYNNYSCDQFRNNIGWVKEESSWYYHNKDNRLINKWIKTGKNWCYVKNFKETEIGWNRIDNTWYYMNAKGVNKTGWIHVNGLWYNTNPINEAIEEELEETFENELAETLKDDKNIVDKSQNETKLIETESKPEDKTQNNKQIPKNENQKAPALTTPKKETPTAAPKPVIQGTRNEAEALQMLGQINNERQRLGLQPLVINSKLQAAAMVRAEEITRSFSHTRPDGLGQWNTVTHLAAGENLAMYHYTAAEANEGLFNSPGHYNNIINANFKSVGLGSHIDVNGDKFWVQLFGY